MEFREEYEQSLKLYESALNEKDDRGVVLCPIDLTALANMGVARCNLRLGNIRQVRTYYNYFNTSCFVKIFQRFFSLMYIFESKN